MSHRVRFSEPAAGPHLTVVDAVVSTKVTAEDTDGVYELFELSGPVGSGAPLSRHPWAEAYYMVEGAASVQIGARCYDLTRGASLTIPPNVAHAFAISSAPARMLVVSLTGAGGRFFAEMDAEVSLADGPDVFVPAIGAVAERNRVTLLAEEPA